MTPEAEDYLAKASEDLGDARKILAIGLGKAAARGAYYVAFHSAELIEGAARFLARITSKLVEDDAGEP